MTPENFVKYFTKLAIIAHCMIYCTSEKWSILEIGPDEHPELLTDLHMVQYQPRHIHLSYGHDPTTEMLVTWSTVDNPKGAVVEYGFRDEAPEKRFKFKRNGRSVLFQESGHLNLKQYIHTVTLTDLVPGKSYIYHCGSSLGWSELFFFKAMKNGTDWVPQLAMFGDLGNVNAKTLTRLQREVQTQTYDAVLHIGDFAYDLDSDDGLVGDAFMDEIQPVAAYVPYMTVAGNHEHTENFKQYKARFNMPGPSKFGSQLYSWNMGPIHFIGFSTEFYYWLEYGLKPLVEQYKWIENDLKEATAPENRTIRPWIITYGHRPMYCSNNDQDDCTRNETLVRVGLPYIYRQFVLPFSLIFDPHFFALVSVLKGCSEKHDPFKDNAPIWSAFRSTDYGYTRLKALNSTTLYLEQISEDQDGKVIDAFHLIREEHKAYEIPIPNPKN